MSDSFAVSRRAFLASATAAAGLALTGCSTTVGSRRIDLPDLGVSLPNQLNPMAYQMYAARTDEGIGIPAVNLGKLKPGYVRADVADPTAKSLGLSLSRHRSGTFTSCRTAEGPFAMASASDAMGSVGRDVLSLGARRSGRHGRRRRQCKSGSPKRGSLPRACPAG